jgi:hypothetical protein
VRVSLFIHPAHAWDNEIIGRLVGWPTFEDWKRRLVAAVAQWPQATGDDPSFQLWDFGGYNCVTTEAVPSFGRMRWHWDVGHFNQDTVGVALLMRMFGTERNMPTNPIAPCPLSSFGLRMTPATIEQSIVAMRAERARYVEERSGELAELGRILSQPRVRMMERHVW